MVDLKVSTLTVVKKADHVGRDEPMVWTMFVNVNLDTINSRQFVVRTNPVAGRLDKAGKGDTVTIPESVGRFRSDKGGMIGVVTIAFDNDLRTNAQIRSGYDAGADALNQAIIDHFPVYGAAPVGDEERRQIQAKISAAIREAFLGESVLLSVFGGKPIGGSVFTRTLTGSSVNEPFSITLTAKNDRARYRIDGKLVAGG